MQRICLEMSLTNAFYSTLQYSYELIRHRLSGSPHSPCITSDQTQSFLLLAFPFQRYLIIFSEIKGIIRKKITMISTNKGIIIYISGLCDVSEVIMFNMRYNERSCFFILFIMIFYLNYGSDKFMLLYYCLEMLQS